MNTDYRPTNSWDFRLRAAKLGELVSMRPLAALSLTVALIALLATLAALLAPPLQAQSLTLFVSNANQSGISDSDAFQAQSFETGANEGGYTVSRVEILLGDVSGKSTSVSIKEDNGDEPGNLVDTLANPGTLTSNIFNTFTAQPVITLAASTTYWITVNEGISSDRVFVSRKPANDEAGEPGWSIGDGSLNRTSEMGSWSDSISSLLIRISGTISTDATLSGLVLEGADGGEAIALSPAFDADTDTYTAAVVNRIDAVKLTATKNDDNAMVVITNDDDQTGSPEEAILDLNIGSNTLTVTVTAQDGNATRTYTVTATRATAPPAPTDCPSDTAWCTTMTLGYRIQTTDPLIYESVGYDGTQNYGDLGTATFTHGGTPYSVSYTERVVTSWMDNTIQTEELFLLVKPELPDGSVFQVDNRTFTVDEHSGANEGLEDWNLPTDQPLSWTQGQHVTVSLKLPAVPISLVSNTHLTPAGGTERYEAQSFETGANTGGYTISAVDTWLKFVTPGSNTSVKIRENNADNEPGDLVATLANPGTLTTDSLNTFLAQDTITLDPSTTYWISVNEDIPTSSTAGFGTSTENAETGEPGWSIGDSRLSRTAETDSWHTGGSSLLMTIKGNPRPASTDATLSALTLEGADGGETITLSPAFDADTETYTAVVVNRINAVKLTAMKNDDNAMVVITNDDDGHGRGGGAGSQRRVQHTNGYRDGAGRHRRANLHGHRGTAYRRHLGEQHASESGEGERKIRLSSSKLRNGHQRRWLHVLRG